MNRYLPALKYQQTKFQKSKLMIWDRHDKGLAMIKYLMMLFFQSQFTIMLSIIIVDRLTEKEIADYLRYVMISYCNY